MYGATRTIAEAIAWELGDSHDVVECVEIRALLPDRLRGVDLLVVGAPTHGRTLPTPESREEAERWLLSRMRGHRLDPSGSGPGLREWLATASPGPVAAAAFTTRADLPRILAGSAVPGITRRLRRRGARVISPGYEGRVDEHGALLEGEDARARDWARRLAARSGSDRRDPRRSADRRLGPA